MSASLEILVNFLKIARRPIYLAIYAPWYGLYNCAIQEYTEDEELLRISQSEVKPKINVDSYYYISNCQFTSQEDINQDLEVKTKYRPRHVELIRTHGNILDRLALLSFKNEYKKFLYKYAEFKKRPSDFQLKIAVKERIMEPTSKNSLCKYSVQPNEQNFIHFIDQQKSFMAILYSQCNGYGDFLTKPEAAHLISEFNVTSPLESKSTVYEEQSSFAGIDTKTKSNGIIHRIPGLHIVSCSSSSDDSWNKEPFVAVLDDDNFTQYLYQEKMVVVMFYAPWCSHCRDMKPLFMEVARELKSEGWESSAAIIDCSVNFDMAFKYQITAFPTIKLFKNGRYVKDYYGKKSKADLKEFAVHLSKKKD